MNLRRFDEVRGDLAKLGINLHRPDAAGEYRLHFAGKDEWDGATVDSLEEALTVGKRMAARGYDAWVSESLRRVFGNRSRWGRR